MTFKGLILPPSRPVPGKVKRRWCPSSIPHPPSLTHHRPCLSAGNKRRWEPVSLSCSPANDARLKHLKGQQVSAGEGGDHGHRATAFPLPQKLLLLSVSLSSHYTSPPIPSLISRNNPHFSIPLSRRRQQQRNFTKKAKVLACTPTQQHLFMEGDWLGGRVH